MPFNIYGKTSEKSFASLKISEIINIIAVAGISLILTGWRGAIGSDVANHLPPILNILGRVESNQDWYAVSTAGTKVHFFYAQLFRIFLWNKEIGTYVFFALFLFALLLRVILISSIIKRYGGPAWWLWIVLAISYASRYHLYGFIIPIDAGLTPRTISWTLALVALRYLVYRDYKKFAFFTGFGCLFQPSDGIINVTVLMVALFLAARDQLPIYEKIRLTFYVIVSGGWFPLYVAITLSKNRNILLEDQYLAWAYVFFRAPYLRISTIEIFLGAFLLSLIIFVGHKMKIEKILLCIALTSSACVLLFCFGVRTLNLKLIEMYGIRSLGFLFLSFTLILCTIIQEFLKQRCVNLKRINIQAGRIIPIGVIMVTLVLNSPISLIKNITELKIMKTSDFVLQYPCTLEVTRCISKNKNINFDANTINYVFPNNYVSFKQVGVGARNLEEWVIRVDALTGSKLRSEFIRQQSLGVYETYNMADLQ